MVRITHLAAFSTDGKAGAQMKAVGISVFLEAVQVGLIQSVVAISERCPIFLNEWAASYPFLKSSYHKFSYLTNGLNQQPDCDVLPKSGNLSLSDK